MHLIFVSATFHINREPNLPRENFYLTCFTQLERLAPKENFDLVYCDNSVRTLEELESKSLKEFLNTRNVFFLDRNLGIGNIGAGELDELIYTCSQVDMSKYDKVIYFTGRRILTTPWIFEKVINMAKNVLICNPPFLHIRNNYEMVVSEPANGLYNDMFFTMTSNLILQYAKYSQEKMQSNLQNRVGSEQNLFNFIRDNALDYEWIECIGVIRIDYIANYEIQLI